MASTYPNLNLEILLLLSVAIVLGNCELTQKSNKTITGCTPLIQSHILYSVKEHVQKRSNHQFKTSWCTKIKHFLED